MISVFRIVAASALFAISLPAVGAENNSFAILSKGKPVGKATYSIDKVKDGWRVRSRVDVRMKASDMVQPDADKQDSASGKRRPGATGGMLETEMSTEYKTSPDGDFLGGYQTDASQTMTSFTPDKTRANIAVNKTQGGSGGVPAILPIPKPNFLFAPSFDPAAIQIFFTTAAAHPHPDKTYLLLVPGSNARQAPDLQFVAIDPEHSVTAEGTLDGKPITLRHFLVRFHEADGDLYTDGDGKLMEADLKHLSVSLVRAKFALINELAK